MNSSPSLLQSDGLWADGARLHFCHLWFEMLSYSPSYELARKHRMEGLDAADKALLPADFEDVLSVFDDLGDARFIDVEDWWREKGIKFFGYEGERPRVTPIGVMSREVGDRGPVMVTRAIEYLATRWSDQGEPLVAIVAIPLRLTNAEVTHQVSRLLTKYDAELRADELKPPRYRVRDGKLDLNSLFRYMKCLAIKSHIPEIKLADLGAAAELSSTYSIRYIRNPTPEDRDALKILASRALLRGHMIVENAARGNFPTYDKCEHAVPINWDELHERLDLRTDEWDGEETTEAGEADGTVGIE